MLYAYTSKELYIHCIPGSSKVMRYKVLCFGVLLLLLQVLLLLSTVMCSCTVVISVVVVISRDFE